MRKVNKTKHLTVFFLVILIFLIGIFFGQIITEKKMEQFITTQRDLRTYILSLDLQSELASEYICDIEVSELTKEKARLGQKLDFLETKLGKNNEEVKNLKIEYSLLSIRHWLFMKNIEEKCNTNNLNIILYFYSNEENTSLCEQQGFVLDYLYKKYPESVSIYAFDINIDTPAQNTIEEIYGIKYAPSLVIDDKLFPGFHGKDELESLIKQQ